ncbi:MAG: ATP-binding protein [Desulfatiglandaceae bacterium]
MKSMIAGKWLPGTHVSRRSVRHSLKIVFSCLTALPFFVFAFIYFGIGSFNTSLSGVLIVLALILVLGGFIVFRRMAEDIEQLSAGMAQAEEGTEGRVRDVGETKELSLIADSFNRTLAKLEETARDLGMKAIQASTLNEIREIVSKTIRMEEVARLLLEKAVRAVNAQAGYLAIKRDGSRKLIVAASVGAPLEMPREIDLDGTLAGLAIDRRSPLLIEDIEQEEEWKALNRPDMGVPRLLYLSVLGKDTPMGALVLGRKRDNPHFEEGDVQFLQILLQQVAYNFENARLYQNLMQSKKELEIALKAQEKAQDQLLASARMAAFGELSASIANELNNPLTGILGYANLLLGSAIEDGKIREYLEIIQNQAVRAGQITRSLLDTVSAEPGSRVGTDLNGLISKSLTLSQGRMSDRGVDLTLMLADKLPLVTVDPPQMEQAFFSLVSNALNAVSGVYGCPPGLDGERAGPAGRKPSLRIETWKGQDKVHISFRDNGPGIDPKDLSRIFEPFYSTQGRVSQVGLGLWLSQRIVKAHGGVIRVKSEPEKGSVFVVILPLSGEG